jgi:hypothetical protein
MILFLKYIGKWIASGRLKNNSRLLWLPVLKY